MIWGYFFGWVASIFGIFLFTGWPVSPELKDVWGNHYNEKNLAYYSLLYLHHFLGALFFPFLVLGLFRNLIWKGDNAGNRQVAFLLAYSVLCAAAIAVYLTHRYSPVEGSQEDNEDEAAVDEQVTNDDKT